MKKMFFAALVIAMALGACGGKKSNAKTGPGSAAGSAMGSGDMGSGAGSAAGSGDAGSAAGSGGGM